MRAALTIPEIGLTSSESPTHVLAMKRLTFDELLIGRLKIDVAPEQAKEFVEFVFGRYDRNGLKHLNQFRIFANNCMHGSGATTFFEDEDMSQPVRPFLEATLNFLPVKKEEFYFVRKKIALWAMSRDYYHYVSLIDSQSSEYASSLKMVSDAGIERAAGESDTDLLQRFTVLNEADELSELKQTLSNSICFYHFVRLLGPGVIALLSEFAYGM